MKLLGSGVSIKDLEPHAMPLMIVYDLFSQQAQRKLVKSADKNGFVMDLTNGISKMQTHRLIIEPLQKAIPEYEWSADLTARELKAVQVVNSKQAKSNQPASGKAA